MPEQPNYILKGGAVIHPFGTNEYYSKVVSDEVAENYLRERPERITIFERYPEDWQERVFPKEKEVEEPVAKEVEQPTTEEVEQPTTDKVEESTTDKVEESATAESEAPVAEEKPAEAPAPKRRGRPSKK